MKPNKLNLKNEIIKTQFCVIFQSDHAREILNKIYI